jgi:5,10-methylenetetrahydromethanopterin reductase
VQLWTVRIPETGTVEAAAERAEAAGWDGVAFTDSQNLVGDPFVAAALAARVTDRLQLGTGVTNVATRDPAALATVAATVQETSGGRFVLGLGRGDTALFHLGRKPQPVDRFVERATQLHDYLGGATVDRDGFDSRLRWLERATQRRVPVDIAASGPRVIAFAAATVERVTFAVGADPARVAWAIDLARTALADAGVARDLVRGSVAAFAHFSAMPGSTGAGLDAADGEIVAEVGRRYDSNLHLQNTAPHAQTMPADFVDRFAVVGRTEECIERLAELAALGLERFVLTGPSFGADRTEARRSYDLLVHEVLPAVKEQTHERP